MIFINEFHYSETAGNGDFVELAYEMTEDVAQCYVVLYNGNGQTYGSPFIVGADGIRGDNEHDHVGGLSFVYFDINNLRGSAGMALVDGLSGDAVLQLISYDGTFTAQNGPAAGMESVDVGVSERGGNPGGSLQLKGSGCQFDHFSFEKTSVATKGHLNTNQAGTCFWNGNTISPSLPTSAAPEPTPGLAPTSGNPVNVLLPSNTPTVTTPVPTKFPSMVPSRSPSGQPSVSQEPSLSAMPSRTPSSEPSEEPSVSAAPSVLPSSQPSAVPSVSSAPSISPSVLPSTQPSDSSSPSTYPSFVPSDVPSNKPSMFARFLFGGQSNQFSGEKYLRGSKRT